MDISVHKVRIRTLTEDVIPPLAESICDPDGWYSKKMGITDVSQCEGYLRKALKNFELKLVHPFYFTVGSEVVGTSRFKKFDFDHRCLEIGGTWIGPRWQRTFVNTEFKFGIFNYCFEHLKINRIEFRVEESNIPTQKGLIRCGAKLELKMRSRMRRADGVLSHTLVYSVIRSEWPEIKVMLSRLAEPRI